MNWSPHFNRRHAMAMLGGLAASAGLAPISNAQTAAKVVIVGGGFGGASAAMTLKSLLPSLSVTLVEPNPVFTACPFSNLVIAGLRDISEQQFTYQGLKSAGIEVAQASAEAVDADKKTVTLSTGAILSYDRLILSPGIDFRWGAIEGYNEETTATLPHAWKAGDQTLLLRDQLQAMPENGRIVMTVPAAPFRCPPGPYERASLIAHFLKTYKPQAKLIVLDSNERFSKMPLFQEAWAASYADQLEWRSASNDGRVSRVDAASKTVFTDFEDIQADVINVIPPQKAGKIADAAGVSDATGWCPINALAFESSLVPGIHVIGDATIATPMPKSAFSANLQAKICAYGVAQILADQSPAATTLANTCYSFLDDAHAISVVGVYTNTDGTLASIEGAGGISPIGADEAIRATEADQARSWFETITQEAFG